jgi:hypothetical protein
MHVPIRFRSAKTDYPPRCGKTHGQVGAACDCGEKMPPLTARRRVMLSRMF